MLEYLKLTSAALLNVALVVLVYYLDRRTKFGKFGKIKKQLIIGLLFGCSSIFASLVGVKIWGATMNVRDASPISAGLIFGPIAGILAGLMGGTFRALTVIWNPASSFTVVACSVSTVVAGVVASLLRRFMFDNKKANWIWAIGITLVLEVFHMLMILITNMQESYEAFLFVRQCTVPMIVANSVSVGLAVVIVSVIGKEKLVRTGKDKGISQTFQRWLILSILVAFAVTSVFTFNLQTGIRESQIEETFKTTLTDVITDINEKSNNTIENEVILIKKEYLEIELVNQLNLAKLASEFGVEEINIINSLGRIVNSNKPNLAEGGKDQNFDMNSTPQSKEFVDNLIGKEVGTIFVQEYGKMGLDNQTRRKYAGITLKGGGFLQVGYSDVQFHHTLDQFVIDFTKNRSVGTKGFVAVCDENWLLVTDEDDKKNDCHISDIGIEVKEEMAERKQATHIYETYIVDEESGYREKYQYVFTFAEEYCVIAAIPKQEAMFLRDASTYLSVFMQVIIFGVLFIMLYFLIKKLIIDNIHKINRTLSKITSGNLNEVVDVRSNVEFASLSDDINATVNTLKKYIKEAETRIDRELEYAKQIQLSALPRLFPNKGEYEIYAQMIAAKEVGGDFYDFYRISKNLVAFLVADVSGKGIPAAMFMMTAKTTIKDLAERRLAVDEIFTLANEKLCENNESGMFVTAWMGILDIYTGKLTYANAGHNPPLICRNGKFEYLKSRAGFVLAGMEGIKYRINELQLEKGDRIFLYTDGVTEATNENTELFGEARLIDFVNERVSLSAKELLPSIKENIDEFVGNAPQFDDITMLVFDYKEGKEEKVKTERVFPAKVEKMNDVLAFVEEKLEKFECPIKTSMAICVAIEEVFVNVANYAYNGDDGEVGFTISFRPQTKEVEFEMRDRGIPFNPLLKPDPDVTLSADERQIGGLGIFITKKTMDNVSYRYEDGQNILTMIKKL